MQQELDQPEIIEEEINASSINDIDEIKNDMEVDDKSQSKKGMPHFNQSSL